MFIVIKKKKKNNSVFIYCLYKYSEFKNNNFNRIYWLKLMNYSMFFYRSKIKFPMKWNISIFLFNSEQYLISFKNSELEKYC